MAELISDRTQTIAGQTYKSGDRIPAEALSRLLAAKVKQLIDQRRLSENSVRVSKGGR